MRGAAEPRLKALSYADLPHWDDEAVAQAWPAFLASAHAIVASAPSLRAACAPDDALRRAAHRALATAPDDARRHFETDWTPYRIDAPEAGFVTAYYEPRVAGSLVRSKAFATPILARPRDLGTREPYPDRRAIHSGAINGETQPVVWLRDAVEVFLIQVQGSARVTLPDGDEVRLIYDGRNGRPYTSIGRRLIAQGAIAAAAMSLAVLKDWLRAHGAGQGGAADAIMNANESYVFFRAEPVRDPDEGPIGGQGLPLTPLRSLAIDRTVWPYGLPFWIRTDAPSPAGRFPRLMIAQDTGSAIVGAARADLFFGSGDAAGEAAGRVRHPADMVVLLPNGPPR